VPGETADDVIARLSEHLRTTHQRLSESAGRFDREQSGDISPAQLSSSLQFLHFSINTHEVGALCAAFPGASGGVRWRDLSARVDTPVARAVDGPAAPSRPGLIPAPITSLLHRIAGVLAEPEFRSRDPRRAGLIPQPEFAGVLSRLPVPLTGGEVRQLSGYYRVTGTSDVNYLALLRDARDIPEPPPVHEYSEPPPPASPPRQVSETARAAIRRFKQFATQRRLSPAELFAPYDAGRTGFVRDIRVLGIFKNVDFPITRAEVDALVGAFSDLRREEYFAYAAFIAAVDREDIASPAVRAEMATIPAMPAVDYVANDACATIREKLAARNKRIASAFIGAAPGLMAADEFKRRIVGIGLILRPGEVQALLRKYQRREDNIAWDEFCADVEASRTIGP
jgi:Ca2+-binding EF-hand superfamily protein